MVFMSIITDMSNALLLQTKNNPSILAIFLKAHFFKNNAKLPIVTRNLYDSAPYFGAYLPEIWGQDRANFVRYSYKKWALLEIFRSNIFDKMINSIPS